jgi:hypothetical protein
MDKPNLTDWLQGWGTVSGSIFSAIAAITALSLYWRETRYRKAETADLDTRQARAMLVTIDTPSRPRELETFDVSVHNFSDQVILNFYIRLYRVDTGGEVTWMSADILTPGQHWVRSVTMEPKMICDRPEHPPLLFEFHVWFTDARGVNWYRRDRRQPKRTTVEPGEAWAAYPGQRWQREFNG